MDKQNVELINLICDEISETVIEFDGDPPRYFLGTIETPQVGETVCVMSGFEITHMFQSRIMGQKPGEQVKLDILKFTDEAKHRVIKFPATDKWRSYS